MATLELQLESGEGSLSVRRFMVNEAVSSPFNIALWVLTPNQSLDLSSIVNKSATFKMVSGYRHALNLGARSWSGVVTYAESVMSEPTGLSTYMIRIAPKLWLLSQRRGNRIFQHLSIPDVVDKLLGEWSIKAQWKIERSKYPKLEYKVQYGESDLQFFSRLLEEAGIAYTFEGGEGKSQLLMHDRLEGGEARGSGPIPFVGDPSQSAEKEFVTDVVFDRTVRPGAAAIRDYDFRNPPFELFGHGPKAGGGEENYEQYHYFPGGSLVETGKAGNTPAADDKGFARYDQKYATDRARIALEGERTGIQNISFETNALDLSPGGIFSIGEHPHSEISSGRRLLVTEMTMQGTSETEWKGHAKAVMADAPYRSPMRTPKPVANAVQSAHVVGPAGQEIHADEFGRVRVQFPWDREGKNNEDSSCWVRVSHQWGGAGFGMIATPRIGQEVLVAFLGGDPDHPVIVGRVYNAKQSVPYKLPDHKTRSTFKSDSSLGGGGFNEIMYEDLKDSELVWMQAEKDRKRLVKHNEFITVVHDRQKLVKNDESDENQAFRFKWVGKDIDAVTKQHVRLRIDHDHSTHVMGDRREQIDGKQSLRVREDRQEKSEANFALRAQKAAHFAAGENMVGEAKDDVTIKGPGGFIRIDSAGITIVGNVVKINAGGSPGKGKGSRPEKPEEPNVVEPPPEETEIPLPPKEAEKTWIEILLVDDSNPPKPVPYRRYEVELPDGSVIRGTLDGGGMARITDIDPGTCKVTFPDFDENLWKRI